MGMIALQPREIARTGTYPGKVPLTRELFAGLVAAFAANPVPVCVGHPKMDSPAYGWLKELWIAPNDEQGNERGFSLWMQAEVQPEMHTAISRQMFTTNSIKLNYAEDGSLILGHVAFLGGHAPAIKGLQSLSLSADGDDAEQRTYQFAREAAGQNPEEGPMSVKAKPDAAASGDPTEVKPTTTPEPPVEPKATETAPDASAQFAAELKAERDKIQKLQEQMAAEHTARRLAEETAFCASLLNSGCISPVMAQGMPEFLAALPANADGLQFAAGSETRKVSVYQFARDLLSGLKAGAPTGEFARRPSANTGMTIAGDDGKPVNINDDEALDAAVMAYAAKNECGYDEALTHVLNQAR